MKVTIDAESFCRRVESEFIIRDPFQAHSDYTPPAESFLSRLFKREDPYAPKFISIWEAYHKGQTDTYDQVRELVGRIAGEELRNRISIAKATVTICKECDSDFVTTEKLDVQEYNLLHECHDCGQLWKETAE